MVVAATTVKEPSENSPIKWASRRRCERKQTPQNLVRTTKGRNWEKTVEDACLLRKRSVARDEGLLPSVAPDAGITFNQWADWFLKNCSIALPEREYPSAQPRRAEVPQAPVRQAQTLGHHTRRYRSVPDDEIEHRQAGAYQVGAATSRSAQTGHRASGVSHLASYPVTWR